MPRARRGVQHETRAGVWRFGGGDRVGDTVGTAGPSSALRTPHTLYVDEVKNFDTSSLRGIPAEGRKSGPGIVILQRIVSTEVRTFHGGGADNAWNSMIGSSGR